MLSKNLLHVSLCHKDTAKLALWHKRARILILNLNLVPLQCSSLVPHLSSIFPSFVFPGKSYCESVRSLAGLDQHSLLGKIDYSHLLLLRERERAKLVIVYRLTTPWGLSLIGYILFLSLSSDHSSC